MNINIRLLLTALLLLFASGCKNFLDVNHDPDALSDAPVQKILPAALISPLYILSGDGQVIGAYWTEHWTQSTNAPQFQDFDSWQITNSTFDSRGYGALYYNALEDLEYIRSKSYEDENWSYYLIATAVQCYVFQFLVDMYDKIPFTEALKGTTSEDFAFTPHFDDGQVVYDSLIARLDYALSKDYNSSTSIKPGEDDVIFNGNMDMWVAFANTLKLKIFLRESFARPDVAANGIAKLEGQTFLTSQPAAFSNFMNQADKRNPIYATAEVAHKGNITISRTLMSLMIDDMLNDSYKVRDKRIDYIANKPDKVPEYHRALLQGDYLNLDYAEQIKYLSTPLLNYDDPVYYFTKAETYFMLAEADLRFWKTGNAQSYYEKGVESAFKRFSYLSNYDVETEEDDIEAILDENDYGKWPDTEEEQLKIIWLQKWISMANIQGIEAFIEHNRTDYPETYPYRPGTAEFDDDYEYSKDRGKFTISVNNVTSDRFPRRFLCPQSELSGNPNVPAELTSKKVYDPVWWDVEH